MSRRAQAIVVLAALLVIMPAAAWLAGRTGAPPAGDFRQVADMTGRSVRVPHRPVRILSLCTSATDTICRLGAAERLAAVDEFSRIVPGAERAAVVGKGGAVSREAVLARGVDLAFVWWYQDDAAAMLEGLSIPVVRIRSTRAAEVAGMIRLVGDCAGLSAEAEALARPVEDFVSQAACRPGDGAPRPGVYLELYGAYKTSGAGSYVNDLLDLAGADNVARDASGSVLLSAERLIQADPDVILFVEEFANAATIAARPGMSALAAVRKGRVLGIDRYWLVAGAHLPEAAGRLRQLIAAARS